MRCLLMGGQACILYGAAEFSRDADLAVLADPANLVRLRSALDNLEARQIAVPSLSLEYLVRGHAVHFRCFHPDAAGLRIDIMSVMRGVAPFEELWLRRTTLDLDPGFACDVLSLPDLVTAKKTQRDKDWPMLRRLLEAHYFANREAASPAKVDFWLKELRTPDLLVEVAQRYRDSAGLMLEARPLLSRAIAGDVRGVENLLRSEEDEERRSDREYWKPLSIELELLRHAAKPNIPD
ncbi:MAG TPA: hypothetical protein VGM51_03435 [Armatimonadota bacterium]